MDYIPIASNAIIKILANILLVVKNITKSIKDDISKNIWKRYALMVAVDLKNDIKKTRLFIVNMFVNIEQENEVIMHHL